MISKWKKVRLISIYAVLSAITNFPSGFTNSTVNTAVEKLHIYIIDSLTSRGFSFDSNTIALIQSTILNCWFVSQIFGAMVTPTIVDRYGRKIGYIACVLTTILATLVQCASVIFHLPEGLILGRSLTAFVSPLGDACLLLYVQETSPIEIRGMSSFLCEIGYGSMCVLGMVLGMSSVIGESLLRLLFISLFPLVFSLLFVTQLPETPKFLMIMKNDRKKALASIRYFQGDSDEHQFLLTEYELEKQAEPETNKSSFVDLVRKFHLRQAMKIAMATLALTLSFYPILQSSTLFLTKSGISPHTAQICSTMAQVVLTASSIFGASIIDRYPRRTLIILFGLLSNALLVCFALSSHMSARTLLMLPKYICLVSLMSYCISFGMVLGPLSWFVAPELVSQRHRCTIFAACFAIQNMLIALTDFATIPLFNIFGGICFIFLFVIPSMFCLLYLYFYMPETHRKSTVQIIQDMMERAFAGNNFYEDLDTPSFQIRQRMFSSASGETPSIMVY